MKVLGKYIGEVIRQNEIWRLVEWLVASQSAHRLLCNKSGRLPLNPQKRRAATLRRIASAESGNAGNPSQPEPPWAAAANGTRMVQARSGGKRQLRFPPAAFRRFRRAKAASQLQSNAALKKRYAQHPNKFKFSPSTLSLLLPSHHASQPETLHLLPASVTPLPQIPGLHRSPAAVR